MTQKIKGIEIDGILYEFDAGLPSISEQEGGVLDESFEFASDDGSETYVRISPKGLHAKQLYVGTGSSAKTVQQLINSAVASSGGGGGSTEPNTIKVLEIGSSLNRCGAAGFPFLASKNGWNVTFASLYVGSMTLAQVANGFSNNTTFSNIRFFKDDVVTNVPLKMPEVIAREEWDYIIIGRGAYEDTTFTADQEASLQTIIDGIRENAINTPTVLFMTGIPSGKSTMSQMESEWQTQINTAKDMQSKFGIDLVPTGTAITNARRTSLAKLGAYNNDTTSGMRIDGDHLDWGIGYYICAATLYEYIMSKRGKSVLCCKGYASLDEQRQISIPSGSGFSDKACYTEPTDETMNIAKVCAMLAVKNPYELSDKIGTRFPIE